MSYPIPIGSVLRHVSICQCNGQISTNAREWQVTNISGGTLMSDVVLSFLNSETGPILKAWIEAQANYYGSMLYQMTPQAGQRPRPEVTRAGAGPGVSNSGLLPTQCCGLVSFYSNVLGGTGQGRSYLPFPDLGWMSGTAGIIAGGKVVLDQWGDFHSKAAAQAAAGVDYTITPVFYKPGAAQPYTITSFISRTEFATQRKRGAFGSLNSLPF